MSEHTEGAASGGAKSPLSRAELSTTDGAIAVANLQGQIEGEEHLATYKPLTVQQRARIADLLTMRGQFLGHIADYERATEMAEALVRDAPNDGEAFLARAKARSTFHRFADALADLETAERLGARARRIESARAGIFQATGRYDEALAIRRRIAEARPTIDSLGAEATLRADRGEIAEAERLFTEAPRLYRDVSPFPIAWLYFQQGLMWMREGKLERARELFAAAHERLPMYAAAQGHLAEVEAALGDRARAVELLEPLTTVSDDPDYAAQLARILTESGQTQSAERVRAQAAARYDDLLARHPEAFADHGAEFWLAAGADAQKALRFAEANLAVRRTPRAYELVLQAASAARNTPIACDAAGQVRGFGHLWPSLRTITSQVLASCGQPPLSS